MKKNLLGLGLLMLGAFAAHSQNGLESIVVEKYYVSNAADAAAADADLSGNGFTTGTLPVGSVTYRIYADMLPGYKFQAAYGLSNHAMIFTTTTQFYNNSGGSSIPSSTKNAIKNNVLALDSYVSVGGAASGNFGILKSEDAAAGGANNVTVASNPNAVLLNADPSAGIALTTFDGLYAGSIQAVTLVGLTTELDALGDGSTVGNSVNNTVGSVAALSGATGPIAATNRVLIAQITTDGVFHYELNVQIGTPSGGTQNFVANAPTGAEISIPSMKGTLGAVNALPNVSITNPLNGANIITGDVVAIAATASDADGTVTQVEFKVDGVSVGIDAIAPYTANYTGVAGAHAITAIATDDQGATKTSTVVNINVANNQAPTASVTAPANGTVYVQGDAVAITGTGADVDGTVSSVEFFVDGVSAGVDNAAPFTANYAANTLGVHAITAKATDNKGLVGAASSVVNINVQANTPPSVSLTAPANGTVYPAPGVVVLSANAADVDGTVTQVDFKVNGVSVGVDNTAPYAINWNSTIGVKSITAEATDNKGAKTNSAAVSIEVADPNALPYKVTTIKATCLPGSFCLPVTAVDSVKNIIGYDMVLHYNKNKVTPTGNLTINSALINPAYTTYAVNVVDSISAMYITLFLNSTAPPSANFHGKGDLFCAEFTKKAAFQSVDTAFFNVSDLQESYFAGVAAKLVQVGNYSTYKDSLFHGKLQFWTDNSPIKYNAALPNQYLISNVYGSNGNCVATSATAVQPNLTGDFTCNILNGLKVKIQRDVLATTDVQSVINGADALLARKVLVNDISFIPSPYQIIALDVNTDGVISAGDVTQINQRAVLMIPEFKQAWNYNAAGVSNGSLSKDWLFVDSALLAGAAYHKSVSYPANDGVGYSKSKVPVVPFCLDIPVSDYVNCPLISGDIYKGIMLGDVNGNYDAIAADGQIKKLNNPGTVVFDLSKAVTVGNYVDVPVSVVANNNVNALDFSFQYNLGNVSTVNAVNYLADAVDNFNTADNTLRFTSNSTQNYDIASPIVSVRFSLLTGAVTAADLSSATAYLNGNPAVVKVIESTSGIATINSNNLKVYPNPSNGILNIESADNAVVQLFDLSGKQVMMNVRVIANERHLINIQDLANGIYMMKISTDKTVATQKIVVNK